MVRPAVLDDVESGPLVGSGVGSGSVAQAGTVTCVSSIVLAPDAPFTLVELALADAGMLVEFELAELVVVAAAVEFIDGGAPVSFP